MALPPQLGQFDDIVSAGVAQAQGAKVALVFSETSDIYLNDYSNAGAGKRSLYLGLRHEQTAVDIVIEDDLEDSTINNYAALFATCSHLREAAGASLARWVHRGGSLFATAGAALLNETNGTNAALASLFGVTSHALLTPHTSTPAEIQYEKQDLPFATVIDHVTLSDNVLGASTADAMVARPLVVYGDKALYTFAATVQVDNVLGSFADGSPAVVRQTRGDGSATLAAFHPGLSYLATAIPRRPVARGATDETFNHWVPSNFSTGVRALLAFAVDGIEGARPVLSSEPLVDIGVIAASGKGTAVVAVNWGPTPVHALNLTLQFECDFSDATLASGRKLAVSNTDQGWVSLVFDLGVADSVILRPKQPEQ